MYRSGYLAPVRGAMFVLLPLALAGCAMFAPRYSAALDANVFGAAEQVETISAQVDLGAYKDKGSFAGASDDYASAIAKLQVAQDQVEGLATGGRIAERQKKNLGGIVKQCSDELKLVAREHQANGLPPNAGATAAVRVACSQAVRAVQAQK